MSIAYLQTAQLAVPNWQIANQQRNHVVQGNMHQVLHDTEQMARRAAATEERDGLPPPSSPLRGCAGSTASASHSFTTSQPNEPGPKPGSPSIASSRKSVPAMPSPRRLLRAQPDHARLQRTPARRPTAPVRR